MRSRSTPTRSPTALPSATSTRPAANPDSDFIPAAVTGHDTVYSWRCTGTTPTIEQQWVGVDDQGFGTNFWYAMLPAEYLQAQAEQKKVKVGERFDVVLKSNPTTGFKWELSWPPNESVVKLVGSTVRVQTSSPGQPPVAGAPAEEVWTFEAVNPGNAAIGFSYRRPWESEPPAQRHTVAVVVQR
ncbi:MAG: protease inhibitor I42 family protein [Sphingomonadaceae bacterium]